MLLVLGAATVSSARVNPGQRLALALVVVSGGLAVPASAQAATLVIPPCSVSLPGERTIPITGSGFAPNSFVSLTADGQSFTSVQADAAGNIAVAATTPVLRSINTTQQTFRVAADDRAGNTAAAPMRLTRVGADLPDRARPSSRVRMRVFGFAPGRVVYLHIRRAGRTRGTFRIGRAQAPCGTTSRRLRYMPLKSYRTGAYTYVFQQSRRYDRRKPRVQLGISVIRRLG